MDEGKSSDYTSSDVFSIGLDAFEKNAGVIGIPATNLAIFTKALTEGCLREIALNGSSCGVRMTDEDLGQLVLCLQQSQIPLESLALRNHHITDDSLEYIRDSLMAASAGQVNTLQHLDLEGNAITFNGLKFLRLNSSELCPLNSLNLCGNPLGEKGALAISEALLSNRSLTSIKLNSCGFTLSGIVAIAASMASGGRHIEELEIDRPILPKYVPGEESSDHFSRILGSSRSLRALSLKYHNIGDSGARLLAYNLNKAKFLISLNLECNKVGIAGAEALASYLIVQAREQAAARNPVATIGGNQNGDVAVGLQHLRLSYNSVGNQGAVALADAIRVNQSLLTLTLKNNSINDEGLLAMKRALEVNNTLQSLQLFGNEFYATGSQFHDLIEYRLPYIDLKLDIKTYVRDGIYMIAEQN